MLWSRRRGARRQEIRRNRPDSSSRRWAELRANGTLLSMYVAAGFCVATICVMMLRENVVSYRPGEYAPTDIVARVAFRFTDNDELAKLRQMRREMEPRVYTTNGDPYRRIEDLLTNLPQQVAKLNFDELKPSLKDVLDAGAYTLLQEYAGSSSAQQKYLAAVKHYMSELRRIDPIVLPADQRHEEWARDANSSISIPGRPGMRVDATYSSKQLENLDAVLQSVANIDFQSTLAPKIVTLTINQLKENPTHIRNESASLAAADVAAQKVTPADAEIIYNPKDTIVPRGEISPKAWQLLRAENDAYLHQDANLWKSRTGTGAAVIMLTIVLAAYISRFQPRIVRNHARGIAIGALMLSMLLLAQIAGIGSSPTYVFGIAPTIVVAMILTIVYDQRFALGIASMHAALVTLALNQSLSFFLVLWAGVLTCTFLLNE